MTTWQPIPSFTAPHYGSASFNQVQKCVNWYHEKTADGFVVKSLPGYQYKGAVANGYPCRGAIYNPNDQLVYSAHGNKVYKYYGAGSTAALTGSLFSTTSATFKMAAGLNQIMLVDGSSGYIVDVNAATVTAITDTNFPSNPISCACFNGQFLVLKGGTDRWYMSAVDDGLTWTPLITGRALTNGDNLYHVEVVRDTVYFMGTSVTEPWSATDTDPYLQPITGATLPVGIVNSATVARLGDAILFYGVGQNARLSFWKIEGGQLSKIATPYIEDKVSDWIYGTMRAFAYSNGGQNFFEVYNTTTSQYQGWQYNLTAETWAEIPITRTLATVINGFPDATPPIGFDTTNGNYYWLGTDWMRYNSNNGTAITRTLDFAVDGGMNRVFHQGLRMDLEVQHDSSSSYTLSATLQKSDDGGATFDTGITLSKAITSGTTAQQVTLQSPPLGSFLSGRTYRLTFTGPAARIILRRAEGLIRIGRF